MTTPFNWQGKPSIFSTGKDAYFFTGQHNQNTQKLSWKTKPNIITLPGASVHLPPEVMKGKNAKS